MNPAAPDGTQVAYLSGAQMSLSQTIPDWPAGSYQISFSAAQAGTNSPGPGGNFEVCLDGGVIGTFSPRGSNFESDATIPFTIQDMTITYENDHTISFYRNYNTNLGNPQTVFIDNVSVNVAQNNIDEFDLADPNAFARDIVSGPDGELWFTEPEGKIGRINPETHAVTEFPVTTPSGLLGGIAAGSDGAIWFTEESAGKIGRIDPNTQIVTEFPVFGSPEKIITGPDGNLWFIAASPNDTGDFYECFDVNDDQIKYSRPGGSSIAGIAVGQDGGIWYSSYGGDAYLTKIDPSTGGTSESFYTGSYVANNLVLGPDGALWGTSDQSQGTGGAYPDGVIGGSIQRFDTSTRTTTYYPLADYQCDPQGIVLGPDGAIWFTETAYGIGNKIGRIDPYTHVINEFEVPYKFPYGFGSEPYELALGPDGAVWFTENGSNTIGRILPADLEVDSEGEDISADDPELALDASVVLGNDADGNPIDAGDGTVIQWRVEGPGGSFDQAQTTTVGGEATNTLHTLPLAGDSYQVFAKIVTLVSDGRPVPWNGPEFQVPTVTVVPGQAADISFSRSVDHLISDGQSQTTITLTARDAEGNLVADGSEIDWDLSGGGQIVDSNPTTLNGKATLVLQAGVMAEDQTVSATIDGYQASTTVTSDKVNISLGITGNLLTLGTSDTATVTAYVMDASGNPVPDNTPITWYTQKGTITGGAVVVGGVASAILSAMGGSQIFGYGYVRAFVGSNAGAASYQWIPQFNGLSVNLKNYLLAGDANTNGSFLVPQVDGSTVAYSYDAQTEATISGPANAVIRVRVGLPGMLVTSQMNVTGDGGQTDTSTIVTLDGNGRGTLIITSLGGINYGGKEIPITFTIDGNATPTTTVNVALLPGQFIAQAKDLVNQMGWSVLTGDSDTTAGMAADIGFSLIPVVGAWTDVRDMGKELLKLWPGGEDPNYFAFGFAAAGIFGSFAGPGVDWLPTFLKKAAQSLGNSGTFKAVWQLAKSWEFSKLSDLEPILKKIMGQEAGDFRNLVNQTLVKNVDDLDKLNAMSKGLRNGTDDVEALLVRIGSDPNLGPDAARKAMEQLGTLNNSQLSAIQDAGKLDYVADSAGKFQLDKNTFDNYVQWTQNLGAGSSDIPSRYPWETTIDQYFRAEGKVVEPNILEGAKQIGLSDAIKQPDRIINGQLTEYKALSNVTPANITAKGLIAAVQNILRQGKKKGADLVVLDVRGQQGITQSFA